MGDIDVSSCSLESLRKNRRVSFATETGSTLTLLTVPPPANEKSRHDSGFSSSRSTPSPDASEPTQPTTALNTLASSKRESVITPTSVSCVCERPPTTLHCARCHFLFTGVLKVVCPEHPRVLRLMAHDECPNCHCPASLQDIGPN